MKSLNKKKIAFLLLITIAISNLAFGQYTWKPLKIGGGGWVTGLVCHPAEANLVYARTDVGGLYKWKESTQDWEQLITLDAMPIELLNAVEGKGENIYRTSVYEVQAIGIDPNNTNTLYITCGSDMADKGIFLKSIDRGESWQWKQNLQIGMTGNQGDRQFGERITVDPLNSNVVYYGSKNQGLWISHDGANTWIQVSSSKIPLGTSIYIPDAGKSTFIGAQRIICDPLLGSAPNGRCKRIYVAVGGHGLYKSEDGGENWVIVFALAENKYFTDIEFSQGTVFMAARDIDLHFYDGTTLTESKLNQTKLFDIAVSPSNKNKVFACTNGMADLYRSTDGGLNFIQLLPTSDDATGQSYFKSSFAPWKENSKLREYLSVGELQLDPYNSDRLWFSEGMGVWRADEATNSNNGPIFNDVSDGIEEMVATDIAVSNSHVTLMTWDRIGFSMLKGQLNTHPTKQTLNTVDFSTGTSVDVSPDGSFMAAVAADHRGCCGNGDFAGYSEDGGINWSRFGSINQTNNTNSPSQLEFGELSISATDNNNMVWISRRNTSSTPYYETKIYYTDNKGGSWTAANVPSRYKNSGFMFLTSKKVMTADRVLGGTFYSYAWSPGSIYKSTDKGHTWVKTSASLPSNAWHLQLKAAPDKAGHVWMVTGYDHREPVNQRGMWYSTDGANNFNKITNVQDAWSLGFGAASNGSNYPTIFIFGKINNQWGVYRSIDQAASWELITTYPLGLFDKVTCMEGDPDIFGRVYMGFSGNSFVYGEISATNQPVEQVVIKPETLSLYETESYNMVGIVKPFDATDQTLSWTSSNPSVASVTNQGTVTALSKGTATISATATNGVSGSATLSVNETFRITGINIPQNTINVAYDEYSQAIQVEFSPVNATFKGLSWSSSNPAIASVDENGVVYGKTIGTALITVTSDDGNFKDFLTIKVVPPTGDVWILSDFDNKIPAIGYSSGGTLIMHADGSSGTLSVGANPSQTGINTSMQAGRFNKTIGNWRLFLFDLLSNQREVSVFDKFQFDVHGEVNQVYVKMTDATGATVFEETQNTSVNGEWTTLSFDLSAVGAIGKVKTISIFLDPTQGIAETYYIDNVGFSFSSDGSIGNLPNEPSGLTAIVNGTSSISLSWTDNSDNEDGFYLERKQGSGLYTQIASVGANVKTYSNTGLSAFTTYSYRVRAYNSEGNSAYSNEISATTNSISLPSAPSGLSASVLSSSQINVSWTDNSSNEDGFYIERKQGSGSYTQIASLAANVITFSNTDLSNSTTYTYRVRAYNGEGNSAYSDEVSATTNISDVFQQTSEGIVSMEAENFTTKMAGTGAYAGLEWLEYSDDNASNTKYMMVPNNGLNGNGSLTAPVLNFRINFVKSGKHYIWMRFITPSANDDSCIPVYNGSAISTWSIGKYNTWTWRKSGTTFNSATGEQTFGIYMREDGAKIDKILLTTNSSYTPTGTGPSDTKSFDFQTKLRVIQNGFNIYPNPAKEFVYIKLEAPSLTQMRLYDQTGKLVREEIINQDITAINISDIPKGIYIMVLNGNNQTRTSKLIIE